MATTTLSQAIANVNARHGAGLADADAVPSNAISSNVTTVVTSTRSRGMVASMQAAADNPESEPRKWTSTAGPLQTKKFNKAIQAFSSRSKSQTEVTGIVGGEEHRWSTTLPFSPMPAQHAATLQHIGAQFNFTLTAKNLKDVLAAIEDATRAIVLPIIDKRRTQSEEQERLNANKKAADERTAQAAAKGEEINRHVAELRKLHPHAIPEGSKSGHARASANVKQELESKFPGIKFTVRSESYSGGNSVHIGWELGPTESEVNAVAKKYQDGHFDGMDDMHHYDGSAYGRAVEIVLGRAKYVSASRTIPQDVKELVGRALCVQQRVEFDGMHTRKLFGEMDDRGLDQHVYELFSESSLPAGATITGLEHWPTVAGEEYHRSPYKITFAVPATPDATEKPLVYNASPLGLSVSIEKHRHTKKNFDMWIVILTSRVERADFDRLRVLAESMNGWYSRQWGKTPGGFAFKSNEEALAFQAVI